LLFVDPFGSQGAVLPNLRALRDAVRWLKQGRMLAVFPAGEVSHFDPATRRVVDPAWNDSVSLLARATGASALPTYFHGHNGFGFQLAGVLHPRLRTALLPRELLRRRGQVLDVRVGAIVPPRKLASF